MFLIDSGSMAATKKVNSKKISKEPISRDQEEEMSSALIAQILAEDSMAAGNDNYYAEYSNDSRDYDPYQTHHDQDDSYEENSEDDFDPKKKKYVSKKDGTINEKIITFFFDVYILIHCWI